MEAEEYARLSALESHLWWFLGMERISTTLIETYLPPTHGDVKTLRVLDAGCGTGGMLSTLTRFGLPIGLDTASVALKYARMKSKSPFVQATVDHIPFGEESFDLLTSFDVLYHRKVASDVAAVTEFARVLKKEGILLIRVPAFNWLRSEHDDAVHGRQRYGRRELVEKIRAAGLEPLFVSYANSLLFPVAVARRLSTRWLGRLRRQHQQQHRCGTPRPGGSEVQPVHPWLNRILTLVLSSEALALRHISLPLGLSLVAVARKPG